MKTSTLPLLLGACAIAALLVGCAGAPRRFTKPQAPRQFTPCSSAPHCVSSQAKPGSFHHVAPFAYSGSADSAHRALLKTLQDDKHATVEQDDGGFVHATFSSTLGFVDDVSFLIQPHIVDVKSSSRLGFSDLGVNGRRVERLRKQFELHMKGDQKAG